ncbi:ATP-dependent helicase [Microvirga tunisiensis]|uniref:DNA 3'-5' helicase n=1 Tax=Microvirga tunisiensis TaxID=2108360 RepID=A0A5N7MAE1_9HYPH|nr:UvrD-helicase domain-containing protein [Microvirga tunisiensis]MPR05683.1 AAA family ATPase [Microvirga tunisiensis]MPR23883.1 AAA family ATPase [Microvirga tunisiensis]
MISNQAVSPTRAAGASILDTLNEDQTRAATTFDRPVLVLAGSGTGKTHILTAKFVAAMDRGIAPDRIMAVTFTRKAAQELRERISPYAAAKGFNPEKLWIGTFHSLSSRILRLNPNLSPVGSQFTTLEPTDVDYIISAILRQMRHECIQSPHALAKKVRQIAGLLDRLKNTGLTMDEVVASREHDRETLDILKSYETHLRGRGLADYGDLIVGVLTLLRNEVVSRAWHKKFDAILVDEYQDINTAQGRWIDAITGDNTSLTCLGDDDQVVYQWRGADPRLILGFKKRYPSADVITLRTNYRSPAPIVNAALRLISHNSDRYEKTVYAANDGGFDSTINLHPHGPRQRDEVLADILRAESIAYAWSSMMVLTRTNAEAQDIALSLGNRGIPVNLIRPSAVDSGPMRLLSAWLRLVSNANDTPALAQCCVLTESDPTLTNLWTMGVLKSRPILEILMDEVDRNRIQRPELIQLVQRYRTIMPMLDNRDAVYGLHTIFAQAGFEQLLDTLPEGERIHFLTVFNGLAADASAVKTLSELADLIQTQMPGKTIKTDAVMVSTMHGVKGLEAPIVCTTGWSKKQFPRSLDDDDIEEQRRLAFVTVTRSSERVHILFSEQSGPSQFVSEMQGAAA